MKLLPEFFFLSFLRLEHNFTEQRDLSVRFQKPDDSHSFHAGEKRTTVSVCLFPFLSHYECLSGQTENILRYPTFNDTLAPS